MDINIRLIDRCISNDRSAQNQLYKILLPYLNLVCQRYLREPAELNDVLQETFIRIFKSLRQFDVQKASFKTWTTRIAINCCFKSNARFKRHATQELVVSLHETLIKPEILNQLSNEALLAWLRKMPEPYFQVFNLYVADGFSHAEIAELLDITEALSRQRLARSRAWLKKKLPDNLRSALGVFYN